MYRILLLTLLFAIPHIGGAQEPAKKLPTAVLIGDSIRMGYAPEVIKALQGKVTIISPKPNGGDSSNVLKNLKVWAIDPQPDLVHINCGLHDLKKMKNGSFQVSLADYEKNLNEIITQLKTSTKAKLVYALTTPIIDERHAGRKANFDRFDADVKKFNEVATKVMKKHGVPLNDLYQVVQQNDPAKCLGKDGTHYTPAGNAFLVKAVTAKITEMLELK